MSTFSLIYDGHTLKIHILSSNSHKEKVYTFRKNKNLFSSPDFPTKLISSFLLLVT